MKEGLLLPHGVVQPFDLRPAADDLHVMAFFAGHDDYEAVEAMIRRRADGTHRVRAILSRHDGTQIDHVNDASAFRAVRSLQRETCLREISIGDDDAAEGRRVYVAFASARGERIEFEIASVGPLDAGRGGTGDPGSHSLQSSLPIMWRGKSALAAPTSRVVIDGVARPIPVRVRAGARVIAFEGYLSAPHRIAAVRAGSTSYARVDQPRRFATGERWLLRSTEGDERTYRIVAVDPTGLLAIVTSGGAPERIAARAGDGRLRLCRVHVGDAADPGSEATLAFDDPGRFSIGIDAGPGLVSGTVASSPRSDGAFVIRLAPQKPDWARLRPIDVCIASKASEVSITTSIGLTASGVAELAP